MMSSWTVIIPLKSPALFSIGVLLLSTRFSGVQITESAVLVGDLNLAAFLPLKIGNTLLGPQYLWVMAGVLVLNVVYLTVLHTRLKLIAFDPELAQTMGIPVKRLGHLTMLVVSVTITAAFNAAGAVRISPIQKKLSMTKLRLRDRKSVV